MHLLWSRAAKTASSRCSTCVATPSTTLAHRPTSAPTRRKLTRAEVFTAFYSAIFATATVIDSKRKEARRARWDEAINEVRHELDAMAEQEGKLGDGNGEELDLSLHITPGGRRLAVILKEVRRVIKDVKMAETPDEHEPVYRTPLLTRRHREFNKEAVLPRLNLELWDDEPRFYNPPRIPQTRVHVDKAQEATRSLAVTLLREHHDPKYLQQTQDYYQTLLQLDRKNIQYPCFLHTTEIDYDIERAKLNTSISVLLQKVRGPQDPQIGMAITLVCHKLLSSRVPPDTRTYTLLMHHLTRLHEFGLAQATMNSFFSESRLEPDHRFVENCVRFTIAKRKRSSFLHLVERIEGMDGGLRVKQRRVTDVNSPEALKWAFSPKVVRHDQYFVERFAPDANVYEQLIRGFMFYERDDQAVEYMIRALKSGCRVSPTLFNKLVTRIFSTSRYKERNSVKYYKTDAHELHRHNIRKAQALFKALIYQWEHPDKIDVPLSFQPATRYAVRQILFHCGIRMRPQNGTLFFEDAWGRRFVLAHEEAVRNVFRLLRFASLERKLIENTQKMERIKKDKLASVKSGRATERRHQLRLMREERNRILEDYLALELGAATRDSWDIWDKIRRFIWQCGYKRWIPWRLRTTELLQSLVRLQPCYERYLDDEKHRPSRTARYWAQWIRHFVALQRTKRLVLISRKKEHGKIRYHRRVIMGKTLKRKDGADESIISDSESFSRALLFKTMLFESSGKSDLSDLAEGEALENPENFEDSLNSEDLSDEGFRPLPSAIAVSSRDSASYSVDSEHSQRAAEFSLPSRPVTVRVRQGWTDTARLERASDICSVKGTGLQIGGNWELAIDDPRVLS